MNFYSWVWNLPIHRRHRMSSKDAQSNQTFAGLYGRLKGAIFILQIEIGTPLFIKTESTNLQSFKRGGGMIATGNKERWSKIVFYCKDDFTLYISLASSPLCM